MNYYFIYNLKSNVSTITSAYTASTRFAFRRCIMPANPKHKKPRTPHEPASSCPYKYDPLPASTNAPPPGPPTRQPKLDNANPMPIRVPIFFESSVRSASVEGNMACNAPANKPYSVAKAYIPAVDLIAIQQ